MSSAGTSPGPDLSAVGVAEVNEFLVATGMDIGNTQVEDLAQDWARCRWTYDETRTRPGGSVSGPTIMSIVDLAAWVAVFTRRGIVPMAVTWDLHVNFLRPAIGRDLLADVEQLKCGRLAYSRVTVYHEDDPDRPVAHATVTYAVPSDDG